MSTTQADALLDELTEGTATLGDAKLGAMVLGLDYYQVDMHEHITIGANRVIVVPEAVKRIAVQFDHNIEVATFDCVRYWDGTDMSNMKIYIEYIRSDGVPGSTEAVDVVVDEIDPSIMHFTWKVDRHTTMVSGKLQVKVCIRKVDAGGYEENHWNTEINNEMFVSMGFDIHELIKEVYPDEFAQLLNRMKEVEEEAAEVYQYNDRLDEANNNASDALQTSNMAMSTAVTAESIAKGKNQAHVFETVAAMQNWLKNSANAGKSMVGDNLYIVATEVPDYWINEVLTTPDATTGYYYKIAELESQKVDLAELEAAIADINAVLEAALQGA